MLNSLFEAFRTLTDVNTFTALVTAGLVLTSYVLIKAMTGSLLLGTLFLPFLTLGGLTGKYVFDNAYMSILPDKDSDTVFAVGCGVLAALIIMTIVAKLIGSILERHFARNHRPGQFSAAELLGKKA